MATAGPRSAAAPVARTPARGSFPVTAEAAAAPAAGPYAASSQEPTLIGEVGLTTRSMFANRPGLPRSLTSAAVDRETPAREEIFIAVAVVVRPVAWAPAASTDPAPARPPRKKYPAMSRARQAGALMTGRP